MIDTSKIPLVDAGNTPFGVVGIYEDITERKKAEEEIRRNESRMMALLELNTMINSALQDITNFALEEAIRLTESKIGYLAFLNEDETILTMYSWSKIAMEECQISNKPIIYPVETTGLWGEAVRQRRPIITNDYAAPNPWKKGHPEGHVHIMRHMNVPVFEGERIVLVAGVGNKKEHYNESDINQLTLLMEGMWRIIQRQRAEDALRESEAKYRLLVEGTNDIVYSTSSEGILTYISPQVARYGWSPEDLISKSILIPICAGDRERVAKEFEDAVKNGKEILSEFRIYSKAGKIFWFSDNGKVQRDAQGNILGTAGVLMDITERKQAEEALRASEDRYRTLFETANDAIFLMDGNMFIDCNSKAVEMFGCGDKSEIIGHSPEEFSPVMQPDGENSLEKSREYIASALSGASQRFFWKHCRKDGISIEAEVSLNSFTLRGRDFLLALVRDVTEKKRAEERIQYLAYYDVLTDLPNRNLFLDRVNQGIARAGPTSRLVAVLIINIDRFKSINDTYGPEVGDRVLKEIAGRLLTSVRKGDTIARLANDEFGIALLDVARPDDIIKVLEKIIKDISYPLKVGADELALSFSTGISVYPNDGKDASDLLKCAGLALTTAKKEGMKTYQFFTADLNIKASELMLMERNLLRAINNKEFILHYQPYWDITTKKMVGMEALIRWQSQDDGLVSPGKFIPVLEDTGMIIEVGEWILREAMRQVKEWQNDAYPVVPVSVNMSLVQFRQRDLAATVKKIMGEFGFYPSLLTLEITESAFMQDIEFTYSVLKTLKDTGVSVSIDDFGTGYSSLAYLKRFPVDNLKIDISFIREVVKDPDSASIVMAIINMAHTLNLKTIAEGIETEEQWKFLRLLKCDMGQGFYLSKPLPAEEIEKFFKQQ